LCRVLGALASAVLVFCCFVFSNAGLPEVFNSPSGFKGLVFSQLPVNPPTLLGPFLQEPPNQPERTAFFGIPQHPQSFILFLRNSEFSSGCSRGRFTIFLICGTFGFQTAAPNFNPLFPNFLFCNIRLASFFLPCSFPITPFVSRFCFFSHKDQTTTSDSPLLFCISVSQFFF